MFLKISTAILLVVLRLVDWWTTKEAVNKFGTDMELNLAARKSMEKRGFSARDGIKAVVIGMIYASIYLYFYDWLIMRDFILGFELYAGVWAAANNISVLTELRSYGRQVRLTHQDVLRNSLRNITRAISITAINMFIGIHIL